MQKHSIVAGFFIMMGTVGILNVCSICIPSICEQYGFLRSQFGVADALFQLSCMVTSLLYPRLFARTSPKKLIVFSGTAFAMVFAMRGACRTLTQFYIAYAASGVFYCLASLIPLTLIIREWYAAQFGLALGICMAGSGLGGVLFSKLSGVLLDCMGWRMVYVYSGIFAWMCIVPLAFFALQDAVHLHPRRTAYRGSAPHSGGAFGLLIAGCVVLSCAFKSLATCITLHMVDLGYDTGESTSMLSAAMAAVIAAKIILGKWYDRYGCRRTTLIASGLGIAGLIALALLNPAQSALLPGIFICAGVGFGGSMATISWTYIIQAKFDAARFMQYSCYFSIASALGSAAAPYIQGAVFDLTGHYTAAFVIFAALAAVFSAALAFVLPNRLEKNGVQ